MKKLEQMDNRLIEMQAEQKQQRQLLEQYRSRAAKSGTRGPAVPDNLQE
jgi:hypothetical protein